MFSNSGHSNNEVYSLPLALNFLLKERIKRRTNGVTIVIGLTTIEKLVEKFMEGQQIGSQGIKGREDNQLTWLKLRKGIPQTSP